MLSLKDRCAKFNVAVRNRSSGVVAAGVDCLRNGLAGSGFRGAVLQSVEREASSLLGPMLVGVTTEWLA